MATDTSHESVWTVDSPVRHFPELTGSLTCDVCVVGAGIAGLTTAYLLARAGQKVVVVDDGEIAGGQTQVTTAHLSNVLDDRFTRMEHWLGEDDLRMAVESHGAAIDLVERLAVELDLDCDFQRLPGYLFLAPSTPREFLDEEYQAARRAGLIDAELTPHTPLMPPDIPAIKFPRQARFHPLKYLAGMAEAIVKYGGKIFTHSHVDRVEGGRATIVQVGPHEISCAAVVVATNVPINDMFAIHAKQAPYMTYVIGARIPRGTVEDALYWDTEDLYHYVRLQPGLGADRNGAESELLIVGGEDHKSGQADDTQSRHEALLAWARNRFAMIEDVEFAWGGQYMETIDGLAFIGRNPLDADNVYVATGDSGMGMTHGTIAGMLLTDLIMKRANPWERIYDPSRKPMTAAGRFLKENLNVARQYADWLTPGEVKSAEEIPAGEGAVLRSGMTKVAVHRDQDGCATQLTAVCPHLRCIVAWNSAEKTWDCPCHGSRFDARGEVINGPANIGLKRIEEE